MTHLTILDPTKDATPTVSVDYLQVPNPTGEDGIVTLIDVSGSQKARSRTWPTLYKKIHGLIFVIDYTEEAFNRENEDVFFKLLDEDDLTNKPILMLVTICLKKYRLLFTNVLDFQFSKQTGCS